MLDTKIKKNFGFGCMRLPKVEQEVDLEEAKRMVDYFIENGFNYFDTARVYLGMKGEDIVKEILTKRYDREYYFLVSKLSNLFKEEKDLEPLFNSQLESLGVEYLDLYLMHAQNERVFEKYKACHAYEFALKKKKEGKIKHFGISFHDTAEVLDRILTEYPEIEVVQLQLNYVDYFDPAVQAKLNQEVCIKHNKQIIVMEPVKGGSLVNLPVKAMDLLKENYHLSPASLAIRFSASQKNVFMVLSGMSNMAQMMDNVSFMKDFKPLDDKEYKLIDGITEIIKSMGLIPCTGCRYCVDGCPKHILIPDLFYLKNQKDSFKDWGTEYYYKSFIKGKSKAGDCIKCGKCELSCPQKLPIRELLVKVSETFDKEA